ncbi:MAG: hypothetical protein MUC69_07960 [Gemmatimonadales bacterium]|jgi:hypothetical protein|nr:hypothetical protein [Gemmatimonadales bacterium]
MAIAPLPTRSEPRLVRRLTLVGFAAAVGIGAVVLLHLWRDIPYGYLTRDPSATMGAAPYLGVLSQVGLMLWASAATLALAHRASLPPTPSHLQLRRFLLHSALLTAALAIDDAFLLHEQVLPRLGVPEPAVMLAWVGLVAGWLAGHARTIRRTDVALLLLALAAFACSAGLDQVVDLHEDLGQLLEEGAKFVGIAAWVGYFGGVRSER